MYVKDTSVNYITQSRLAIQLQVESNAIRITLVRRAG